jgi:hypothetical protein
MRGINRKTVWQQQQQICTPITSPNNKYVLQNKQNQQLETTISRRKPETQKQKIQANHQTHQLHKQTCKTTTTNLKDKRGKQWKEMEKTLQWKTCL